MDDPALDGTVVAVAAGRGHHFSKPSQYYIDLLADLGVEGDAHCGRFVRHRYLARRRPGSPNLRQVHLIPTELFHKLRSVGYGIEPGELGENIATAGLDLEQLPLGARISLGPVAVVELTGLRTPCVLIDRFKVGLRKHLLESPRSEIPFRCGVIGIVLTGGRLAAGDLARVLLPSGPKRPLPPL